MRVHFFVVKRLATVAALAALAACSGTSSGAPVTPVIAPTAASADLAPAPLSAARFDGSLPSYVRALNAVGRNPDGVVAGRKSWIDRAAFSRSVASSTGAPLSHYNVFVSNPDLHTVDIYQANTYEPQNPNPPLIGQIQLAHTPLGLTVDRNQNLYVVTYGHGIIEYSPYSMPTPIRTFDDPYFPQGIAVGPDGTLYAANTTADPSGNIGISVFPKGTTEPTKILTDPSFAAAFYPTVDINGNVYVTYADKTHSSVGSFGVFKSGSSTFTPLPLVGNVYQVELDASGDLLAADPTTAAIDTYLNGTNTIAKSVRTEAIGDFFLFDQTYARNQVFTEPFNSANGLTGGPVLQFTYPQGVQLDTILHGHDYLFGITTSPQAPLPQPYSPAAPSAPPSASAARELYVVDNATSVKVFGVSATGNVAPTRVLTGANTGIDDVLSIAVDRQGELFEGDGGSGAPSTIGSIRIFAAGANGNSPPIRVIAGPKTQIALPSAIAVDNDGTLYVAQNSALAYDSHTGGPYPTASILRFAPGASGNVAPQATYVPPGYLVQSMVLDSTDTKLIYVGTSAGGCCQYDVTAVLKTLVAPTRADPVPVFSKFTSGLIADDEVTHSYYTLQGDHADESTNGNSEHSGFGMLGYSPALLPSIKLRCARASGVAVDAGDEVLYAFSPSVAGCASAIDIFAPEPGPSSLPVRTISGPATTLVNPQAITTGP